MSALSGLHVFPRCHVTVDQVGDHAGHDPNRSGPPGSSYGHDVGTVEKQPAKGILSDFTLWKPGWIAGALQSAAFLAIDPGQRRDRKNLDGKLVNPWVVVGTSASSFIIRRSSRSSLVCVKGVAWAHAASGGPGAERPRQAQFAPPRRTNVAVLIVGLRVQPVEDMGPVSAASRVAAS